LLSPGGSMPIKFYDNSAIPQRLYNEISKEIFKYSIMIIGIKDMDNDIDVRLLGSGTLVKYKNKKGILTAKHLVDSTAYRNSHYIGFSYLEKAHNPKIEKDYLFIEKLDDDNCDFAFINLPFTEIGWIEAKREFWNLEKYANIILKCEYANEGLWLVGGAIDEYTINKSNVEGFDKFYGFKHMIWPSEFESEYDKGMNDEIDILVEYTIDGYLPKSFGGTSGGSLWQIPLKLKDIMQGQFKAIFFTGIPFYQEHINRNKFRIKCEGRKSIYKACIDLLSA
jgi:hypothetical protein